MAELEVSLSDAAAAGTLLAPAVTTDTVSEVDRVFRKQRKLSFTYAAVFFATVLLIPYLAIKAPWWYGQTIWGGVTLNFMVISVVFHVFYWVLGLCYTIQSNRLEDELLKNSGI